ncbi:uncharacterized [Tachysurus ichikawai]
MSQLFSTVLYLSYSVSSPALQIQFQFALLLWSICSVNLQEPQASAANPFVYLSDSRKSSLSLFLWLLLIFNGSSSSGCEPLEAAVSSPALQIQFQFALLLWSICSVNLQEPQASAANPFVYLSDSRKSSLSLFLWLLLIFNGSSSSGCEPLEAVDQT